MVFLFRSQSQPILVFHAIISDINSYSSVRNAGEMDYSTEDYTISGRFRMMQLGIRNTGQTLIEAAVWGTTDVEVASNTLKRFLQQSLVMSGPEVE